MPAVVYSILVEMTNQHRKDASDLERKRAESDALFWSIGEGAIATDEKGRISRVNSAALEILGFSEKELMGSVYHEKIVAVDENDQPLATKDRPIVRAMSNGRPISTRLIYRRKRGGLMHVYLTVSAIMLGGKPIGAIQVFRDITKEVELEHAKDEFISLASHQLRTPATAVKQYAGMLLQGYVGDITDQQRGMLQNIYESNERQISIINDLLRVAQVDAGKVKAKKKDVDMGKVITSVVNDMNDKFRNRQQKVVYVGSDNDLRVRADPQLIRMVIENIVDNASKYTPEGKSITIDLYKLKDHMSVSVRDEGIGIDEKDLPQLFKKFSRVPNILSDAVGGTGLGLYWAKKIVDLHGGQIKVSSKPKKGTTFIIQLPLHDKPT
jgi:PAS domain S-box-containing protein